jgi:hypothetical protein
MKRLPAALTADFLDDVVARLEQAGTVNDRSAALARGGGSCTSSGEFLFSVFTDALLSIPTAALTVSSPASRPISSVPGPGDCRSWPSIWPEDSVGPG